METTRQIIARAAAEAPFFAGIDLGGTNIKVGLVDNLGRTLGYKSVPSEIEEGPDAGAKRMGDTVRAVAAEVGVAMDEIAYVGLATPGTMDVAAGMLLHPANLPGWHQFPIRDRVAEECGLPLAYVNDANAAAFGEYWVGSGAQYNSMILITLGTGVGGGIIIGDLSVDGEHSHGSELGHIIIDCRDDARACPAGRGHLEAYASATALVERTRELLTAGRESSLSARLGEDDALTARAVAEAAEAGDELAHEIIMETAGWLGLGIVTMLHAIDPGAVLLGGAMTFGRHETQTGRDFLAAVKAAIARRTFPTIAENVVIDYASLGGDAGYIGAAGVARAAYAKQQ